MKVAVVMTVKNEARLLRQNVLYHLGIGVEKLFIYFDHTTDHGRQSLSGLEGVALNDSVNADTYQNLPYLKKFWSNAQEHHTARQCLNTYDALQKCKDEHIDWLISLDADELFLSSKNEPLSLKEFFKTANQQAADLVNLRPMEVISRKMAYQHVMLEETLFKTQKNFRSKFDQIYQKIYDPYAQTYHTASYWSGHTMGKAAIRVQSAVVPHNVHRYTSINGANLKTIDMGYLLHYHIYDLVDFINKFQNFKARSDKYLSGNKINNFKGLWIKLVNDPEKSNDYLKSYYEQNLLFTSKKMDRLQQTRLWNILTRKEKATITIDLPHRILSSKKNEALL